MIVTNVTGAYFLKQNDTATRLRLLITEVDGETPVDLQTAVKVEVVIGVPEGRVLVKTPDIMPEAGELEFGLDDGDLLPTGDDRLEVHVFYAADRKRVAPSKGYYRLRVQEPIDLLNTEVTTYTLDYFMSEVNRITNGLPELIVRATELSGHMDELIISSETALDNSNTALARAEAIQELADAALADALTAIAGTEASAQSADLARDEALAASVAANNATNNANDAANAALGAKEDAEAATADALAAKLLAEQAASEANIARDGANMAALIAEGTADSLQGYNMPIEDYSSTTTFIKHQAARSNGSTYRAKKETTGDPLPIAPMRENEWWTLEAQRGTDGTGAVSTVNGVSPDSEGNVELVIAATKEDVGLGNVDNTSDINKPVSTAQQQAIDAAVNTIVETGIPKLVSYETVLNHMPDAHDGFIFNDPLFNEDTDTLLLWLDGEALSKDEYSFEDRAEGRVIWIGGPNFAGVSEGALLRIVTLRNVPVGPNGSINANVLSDGTIEMVKMHPDFQSIIETMQAEQYYMANDFWEHSNDTNIHVTEDEKADIASTKQTLIEHMSDSEVHVTDAEKLVWYSKLKGLTSLNGMDLNNITDSGFYYGYTFTNGVESVISVFEVLNYSKDWIYQRQTILGSNGEPRSYERVRHNGTTWGSWRRMVNNAPTTWIQATLVNGFTGTIEYFKDQMGFVHLKWSIVNIPYVTPSGVLTTLPSGYRPTGVRGLPSVLANLSPYGGAFPFAINNTGEMTLAHNNGLTISSTANIVGEITYSTW